MVKHPLKRLWGHDPLVTPHNCYKLLGSTPNERCKSYLAILDSALTEEDVHYFRLATKSSIPVGTRRFLQELNSERVEKSIKTSR